MIDPETVGAVAKRAKAAAPASIDWNGWRLTYIGQCNIPQELLHLPSLNAQMQNQIRNPWRATTDRSGHE